MRQFIIFLCILLIPSGYSFHPKNQDENPTVDLCYQLYMDMQLDTLVEYKAFEQAIVGYHTIDAKNKNIITLIDFTKPSTQKRLFVLNIEQKEIVFASHVAHGKNSGDNYAVSFSNKSGSNKSSLGFYLTGETYEGRNGYSLILNGLEKNINDKARQRSIVIHAADYCDPEEAVHCGRLGRSWGCPALPNDLNEPIINAIKGGTLLFIYADNQDYLAKSPILKKSSDKG